MLLGNGRVTHDARLDRIPRADIRNSEFPVQATLWNHAWKQLRSYTWQVPLHFDQGKAGGSVAYALAHHLIARPRGVDLVEVRNLLDTRRLYWQAQKRDPWPGGCYPGADPQYEGVSLLAGVKQLKAMGFISSYHWAARERDIAAAVAWHAPVVVGVAWHEGMLQVDRSGYINPTGAAVGSHCVLVCGIDLASGTYRIRNSWSPRWGVGGDCLLRRRDLALLMCDPDAEACLPIHH